jgi:hypothetical protein
MEADTAVQEKVAALRTIFGTPEIRDDHYFEEEDVALASPGLMFAYFDGSLTKEAEEMVIDFVRRSPLYLLDLITVGESLIEMGDESTWSNF